MSDKADVDEVLFDQVKAAALAAGYTDPGDDYTVMEGGGRYILVLFCDKALVVAVKDKGNVACAAVENWAHELRKLERKDMWREAFALVSWLLRNKCEKILFAY